MTEDERKVVGDLIEGRIETYALIQKIFKWLIISFITVSACFTISILVVCISWANTLQDSTHDYFYSDYGYGSIEQSVTQRVEQEVVE